MSMSLTESDINTLDLNELRRSTPEGPVCAPTSPGGPHYDRREGQSRFGSHIARVDDK